jgi:filamentous hemagglutinin family protein
MLFQAPGIDAIRFRCSLRDSAMQFQWQTLLLGISVVTALGWQYPGVAQLVPDGTLGNESSVVTPNASVQGNPADLIEGGAQRGSALFHSFADFNVNDLQRVYFANPAGVFDIFTRVTGSDVSNIYGTLGVDGMANLFLLNPNGVYFGPNARLDIRGSFLASTADSFTFGDDLVFGASNPQGAPPLLTLHITPGLQYGNQPGMVANQSVLEVGQDLTLAGHRLEVGGELRAGRDIMLQGAERQLSEGTYTVGGYLFTQDLTGSGVEMVSPHPNTIVTPGDVQLEADYEGPSLHILAGGQVAAGTNDITVTSAMGGSVTDTLSDGVGSTQVVTVHGTTQPTVDIRSGVAFANLMGTVPGNANTSGLAVSFGDATGQSMTLDTVTNHGGEIFLQSATDITATLLDTSMTVTSVDEDGGDRDGGPMTLVARQDITLTGEYGDDGNLRSFSRTGSETENIRRGNGETITLTAGGNISGADAVSRADSYYPTSTTYAVGGNGGDITFTAGGTIANSFADSSAYVYSTSAMYTDGGDGGDITFTAGGNIADAIADSSADFYSISSVDAVGGNGGDITFTAGGTIANFSADSSTDFYSESSFEFVGGDGGDITLMAGGNISHSATDSSADFFSASSLSGGVGGDGGDITFTAGGNIADATADSAAGFSADSVSEGETVGGNGGNIIFTAGGNIADAIADSAADFSAGSAAEASTYSYSPPQGLMRRWVDTVGGDGGDITLIAGGNISDSAANSTADSSTYLRSTSVAVGGDGGDITFTAGGNIVDSVADSSAETFSISQREAIGGNGGDITLTAGGNISASAADSAANSSADFPWRFLVNAVGGNGGDITLTAGSNIVDFSADASAEFASTSSLDAIGGDGGDITLTAGGDIVDAAANAQSTSYASPTMNVVGGDGGNVTFIAEGDIELSEIQSFSYAGSDSDEFALPSVETGQGGTITLFANRGGIFSSQDSLASLSSFSFAGNNGVSSLGGTVVLAAATAINDLSIFTTSASAQSGDVNIIGSGDLSLQNLNVVTSQTVEIYPPNQEPFTIEAGGTGQSGNIVIASQGNLTLVDSTINSTSNSLNPASNITIISPGKLTFSNSQILLQAQNQGAAGSIVLNANDILVDAGSQLSTSTVGAGTGGNIDITANTFTATNNSQVQSYTEGEGAAGNMTFTLQEALILSGANTGLFSGTAEGSSGPGGNIDIDPHLVQLNNGAQISVSSAGTGGGGNITLTADVLSLDNASKIIAETASANGGNIILTVADLLWMRHGSLISTTAGTNLGAGDGGNITIDNPRGFIIAIPSENSDISANALAGNGGNINISTSGLLGLDYRPTLTPLSDITASSNFGFDGTVTISIGGIDLNRWREELPTNLVDKDRLIQPNYCSTGDGSEFIITGQGGCPQSSCEYLCPDRGVTNLEFPAETDNGAPVPATVAPASSPAQIIEATHLVTDGEGRVRLVSDQDQAPHWPLPECSD